ncbi:type 1 glutamine amidotransferase [Corynebacterium sp. SCR221107]|uniref:type 1 glutamine amidotransferase n=2 Tax=Bacteria TaxID=2 RepID=UPI0022EC7EAE|nr:type 1 glutamine amidotransferase [Corynebacterium sp. SCR221107]WBT07648.1 type 1 glutamine amidotransferase [Corynebacterium sp. SCR221107]
MITVLQPDTFVPLDRFTNWLAEEGQDFRVVPLQHQPVPSIEEVGDGLIILGGRKDSVNVEESPFLPAVCSLLHDAYGAQLPVLGICLGHQIMGHVFDGQVTLGHPEQGEEGAFSITLNEQGQQHPLFTDLDTNFLAAESHHDVVTAIPEGATLLASSQACPVQAFALGSLTGVQFHPEVSPATMGAWTQSDGGDGNAMAAHMRRHDDAIKANGRLILKNFVDIVNSAKN